MRIPKLTYSNVAATLALFLALGGGAYAISLGKGSVKRVNIANGAVSTKKLAKNAVTGAKANESTFGTVPSATDAAKLGGVPPGGYVSGQNAIQRVHNEAVQVGEDGVSFVITGIGSVQFTNCATPGAGNGAGTLPFTNTSGGDEQIWIRAVRGGGPAQVDFTTVHLPAGMTVLLNLPNNVFVYGAELQISSASAVTMISFALRVDQFPSPDVCQYSLWTSKTEEEQG